MGYLTKLKDKANSLFKSDDLKLAFINREKQKHQKALAEQQELEREIEERKEKQRQKMLDDAYKKLFSSQPGKIVLEDLEKVCYQFDTCYSDNEKELYMRIGKREALLEIINRINKKTKTKG